jgi:drug/metabolite transporter (DMT)-like permease
VAAFAAIYILWGTTYLAVAVGVQSIPPFLLMCLRSIGGGLMLVAAAKAIQTPWPPGRTWIWAAISGLLFFVGCHGVLAFAQQRVPSGMAAILLATIPFWLAALNYLMPGKRPTRIVTLAALIPGLAGVAFIAWQQLEHAQGDFGAPYIFLLLGAAFSWAVGSLVSQRHSEPTSAIMLSGLELAIGGLVLLGISGLSGEFKAFDPGKVSVPSGLALAYLTLAGTVVAFAAYNWLLNQVSETLVATYTFVNPVIAVLAGWIVLGERLTMSVLLGGVLVIASIIGVLVLNRSPPEGD